MKALKRIDSTIDNPIWGEFSKEGYYYTVNSYEDNTPTLFPDYETMENLINKMTSLDSMVVMMDYELIEVEIKPKTNN